MPKRASGAFARIILKACAYDPAQRFASAREMRAALQTLMRAQARPFPAQGQRVRESGTGRRADQRPERGDGQPSEHSVKWPALLAAGCAALTAITLIIAVGIPGAMI